MNTLDSELNASHTFTAMPSNTVFDVSVDLGFNFVISTDPGLGTVNDTLAALRSLNKNLLVVDALALTTLGAGYLDTEAEIILIDEAHLALPMVREQIAELMHKRTINGESMDKLSSVVVIFTHRNTETDAYAAQLAELGPTVSINIS